MNVEEFFDLVEGNLATVAVRLGSWLAPVPTAFLIWRSTMLHLGWPWQVSLVAGAVIELLGMGTVNLALTFREHNETKREVDPSAPFGLAMALAGVYFGTVTLLTMILEVMPGVAVVSPLVFIGMSVTGAGTLMLRRDHVRRLETQAKREAADQAAADQAAAERKARQAEISKRRQATKAANQAAKLARADRPQTVQDTVSKPSNLDAGTIQGTVHEAIVLDAQNDQAGRNSTNLNAVNESRRAKRARYLDAALDYLCTHPEASYSELGRHLDVSKSAAANYAGELINAGKVKRNGQGWEPVGVAQ